MGALNFFTRSLHPLRCHVVSDRTTKSSLQVLIDNALGKTRQLLRVFYRKKNVFSHNKGHYQFRSPVELSPKDFIPTVPKRSTFFSYRPGFIREVTSKWVSNSLAGIWSKETQKNLLRGKTGPTLCFVGFALAKKPSLLTEEQELEGVSFEIRETFENIPWQNYGNEISSVVESDKNFKISDLKIGDMIAKGCNAAVYSACLEGSNDSSMKNVTDVDIGSSEVGIEQQTKLIMSHFEGEQNVLSNGNELHMIRTNGIAEHLKPYNLAVKVMFNYSAESNAYAIWRAMYKEMLPVMKEFNLGEERNKQVRKKRLKPHPNIVEMYFAFADLLPLLPGAFANYPQALPLRLLSDGCGRNMTLFLVMKRYHCSLQDYLKTYEITTRTALLLFTQLLEALAYLLQNEVTHRDLKTDNILLDLTYGASAPRLAITDFGCSLESLQLPYYSHDIEKGGNMALMAPEVVNAEPGPFSVIDYSRSDLWTAATLAYEIFGGTNPFYSSNSHLRNDMYNVSSLPPLPARAPPIIQKLVKHMLSVNPSQRPSPSFAATVCQILLHAPSDLLSNSSHMKLSKRALEWMFLMSAETYLEASLKKAKMSTIELELKRTFCSRIQYLDIVEALKYIHDC